MKVTKEKKEKAPKVSGTAKAAKKPKTAKTQSSTAKKTASGKSKASKTNHTKKISTRMLLIILPGLIAGLTVLTVVSAYSSKKIIDNEIEKQMNLNLESQKEEIKNQMGSASALARHMAGMVALTYENEDLMAYVNFLSSMIFEEDFIYGSGIWFEPYAYKADKKYVGPYVYKKDGEWIMTYEFANVNYDYGSKDFYTCVEGGTKEIAYTEPRYDEILKCSLVTSSAPIIEPGGRFMGVVSVDVTLDTLQELVGNIRVGDTGTAFLVAPDGTYLYSQDEEKIMTEKITDSENPSLAKIGGEILSNEKGIVNYKEGLTSYRVYYETVPGLNWKIAITIEEAELNKPVVELCIKLIAIALVVLVLIAFIISTVVRNMAKQINHVRNFAKQLADGNFTVHAIENKRADELGMMGESLNDMFGSNKDMIRKISNHAEILNTSSTDMKESVVRLQQEFQNIEHLMDRVNSDMANTSAATEEVNAAVQEVHASMTILANETERSLELSGEIKDRAHQIETTSTSAYTYATELAGKHREGLEQSIRNADVVKSIGDLAEVISEIAEQINLLSLNASIEAARAGDQGKGFAVVASEIGKLANQTTAAVNKIKDTIVEVENAFGSLVDQSKNMLQFVSDTVAPDYDSFVNVSKQYGDDALTIEKLSNDISDMVTGIEMVMQEVGEAIHSVSESSQNTLENSNNIMNSVNSVSDVVTEVSDMSVQQDEIAGELQGVVGKFIL